MIGLSLLPSPHPKAFQRLPVRPSGRCYPPFSLDKGRSPGFASAVADLTPSSGSLSLRLRASLRLASPATATRGLIMQKARRHRIARLRPLAGAWFQGLFHSSARGSFHLSLTVLVHCRSPGSIQPCGMVPADSRRIPRVLRYSGGGLGNTRVSPKGLSPAMAGVSTPFGYARVSRIRPLLLPRSARRHAAGLGIVRFRSPLLAESLLFSLPAGTEMFQFPALALALPVSLRTGFPIRTSADLFVFADPRGFSQLVTSFLASGSLRHPPCALVCFPFSFPTRRGCSPRPRSRSWFCFYSCVYTMSMTSPSCGE